MKIRKYEAERISEWTNSGQSLMPPVHITSIFMSLHISSNKLIIHADFLFEKNIKKKLRPFNGCSRYSCKYFSLSSYLVWPLFLNLLILVFCLSFSNSDPLKDWNIGKATIWNPDSVMYMLCDDSHVVRFPEASLQDAGRDRETSMGRSRLAKWEGAQGIEGHGFWHQTVGFES